MKGLFLVTLSLLICGCWSTDPDLEGKVVNMDYSLILDVVLPTSPPPTIWSTEATETDETGPSTQTEVTTTPGNNSTSFGKMVTGSKETGETTVPPETTVEVTTEEPTTPLTGAEIVQIIEWLNWIYNNTTGFMNVSAKQELFVIGGFASGEVNIVYTLEYNLTMLSVNGKLPNDNTDKNDNSIFLDIVDIQDGIAAGVYGSPLGDYKVDKNGTEVKNSGERETAQETIVGEACATVCDPTNREEVCISKDGSIECADKCEEFNDETGCTYDGILQNGTCRFDDSFNPYCDCGKCGLLDNFYDTWGKQCVNSCLVVGATAGGVGLILIILIISIACVASDRNSKAKQLSQYEEIQKNAMDSKAWPVNPEDGLDPLTQSVHEDEDGAEPNPESRAQTPKSGRSARSGAEAREEGSTQGPPPRELANGGGVRSLGTDTSDLAGGSDRGSVRRSTYDNKAYQQENDPAYADLLREYENFEPQLNHIDPYVDYKISRPMLTENKY